MDSAARTTIRKHTRSEIIAATTGAPHAGGGAGERMTLRWRPPRETSAPRVPKERALARAAAGIALAGALLFAFSPARADDVRHSETRRRLEREIAHLQAERDRLARDEQGVLGRLERLEAEARLLDARLEALSVDEGDAREQLATTRAEHARIAEQLAAARAGLATTVEALWRVGPVGRMRPILAAADAERMAAALRLAHELSQRQKEQVAEVRDAEVRLALLEADLETREARVAALREETADARAALTASIGERRRLLARIREDDAVRTGAIEELRRAKTDLDRVIEGLPASTPPALDLDVHKFRGLLPLPVAGRVTRAFGDRKDPRFGTRIPHPGWDIEAEFGDRVRPIFDGKVVFADWFRGYGLMVVVDHGGGVHSVYAHLSAILAPAGTNVTRDAVLGRVGDTGSLSGPHLYFEIRKDGRAEDPSRWVDRRRE